MKTEEVKDVKKKTEEVKDVKKKTEEVKDVKKKTEEVKDSKKRTKNKGKIKASQIVYGFIVLISLATFILYYLCGWKTTCYNISLYLDAAVESVLVVILASALQKITSFIIGIIKIYSQRGKTVAALVKSIIKYCIAIATIIAVLVFFLGSKYITELFTGLGVLALIIGLGCQTLISDIVAGIFMVFEGNFEVGDVVVINGWRGTVSEIGLRTTVIEDVGGNKKIISNSNISEIVNNSKSLSIACCLVGVEYDESIEKIENVMAANLDSIRQKIPAIIEGPFYKGIEELAESSVNLKIVAKCKEDDKFQVQRDLNREIKLVFDKNNIGIPYPQVTLSYRQEEAAQRVTANEKKNAREFIEEQKKNSYDTDNII